MNPAIHPSPTVIPPHISRVFTFLGALICVLGITACNAPQGAVQTPQQSLRDQAGILNVFFTDPERMREGILPSEALKAAIHEADESIDLAIYNFNDPVLANALVDAHDRGVAIRIVMEDENAGKTIPLMLQAAGIPLVSGNEDGLMHNKFAIIDGTTLWMGSLNFTTYGFQTDNNYFVEINDSQIASAYQQEFDELFISKQFGAMSMNPSTVTEYELAGKKVEVYFSPEDHIAEKLISLIKKSNISIHFLTSSFTSDDLASAIIEKSAQGVEIRGVFDESSISGNEGTEYDRLRRAGLDIRLDSIEGQMHEKVIIIDGGIVAIGSYNYTVSAEKRNDENIMIIHDPQLAQVFETEFQRIFEISKP